MGYALAEAAIEAGAYVTLVSGPVNIPVPERVKVERVESALEMHHTCIALASKADIFIGAAAVGDYRVAEPAVQKLKKSGDSTLTLTLVQNPDIVKDIAALADRPYVVGFAAETQDVIGYAKSKLQRKGLDMIIANDVSDQRIGFNSQDNAVTVIGEHFEKRFELSNKRALARDLIAFVAEKHREISEGSV